MTNKSPGDVYAAVTQHSSEFRYLELSGRAGAYKVERHVVVPALHVENSDNLASYLIREMGSFNAPVVFGLPPRECMIRVIEYPRMPIDEAKQALQFDFDRHFTWPYSECSVDVCEVESPLTSSEDNMSILVAACRNEHIAKILRIADKTGMNLKAIEPMNVAVLRAIMEHKMSGKNEGWYSLYSDADGIHIAFVDNNNGLLYRSGSKRVSGIIDAGNEEDVQIVVSEIQRTVSFISSQFKGVSAGLLILSGAIVNVPDIVNIIGNSTGLRVQTINVYEQCGISTTDADAMGDGFEPALGLCMYNTNLK